MKLIVRAFFDILGEKRLSEYEAVLCMKLKEIEKNGREDMEGGCQ
jgi:hypothetical protein